MKPEDKKKKWHKIIKDYDKNGRNIESKKQWCEQRKISFKAFGYWYSRYGADTNSKYRVKEKDANAKDNTEKNESISATQWLEVKLSEPETQKEDIQEATPVKVQIGKAEISVSTGFDTNVFKDVAKILGELC